MRCKVRRTARRLLRQSKRRNTRKSANRIASTGPTRPARAVSTTPAPPADAPLAEGCDELFAPDPAVPSEPSADEAEALPPVAPALLEPFELVAPATVC